RHRRCTLWQRRVHPKSNRGREAMKRIVVACGLAALIAFGQTVLFGQGQGSEHATVVVPESSVEQPGDRGVAAHTNHLLRVDPHVTGTAPRGETPASLAAAYGLTGTLGGANTIVIVDAYH